MADQALADVKVLDLTWYIAGPYCTKLLADYGADVIKVERPGEGDPARRMGPFLGDDPHPEKSGLFLHLNTNKRGITLNLKSQTGKKLFKELVKDVDILVESFSPGVMERLGLSYEELEKLNPRLVMTSISNFGQTGPYRDFKSADIITYAMGGPMFATGLPDQPPLRLGPYVMQYQTGATAAVATMVSLHAGELRGSGEHVDVSLMEAEMGNIDRRPTMLLAYQYTGSVSERLPLGGGFAYGVHPCKDGYIDLVGRYPNFDKVARMLNMPELLEHPRFPDAVEQTKPEVVAEFKEIFLPWLMAHTKREIWQAAQKERIVSAPIYTTEDLVTDPHFQARASFVDVEHPATGTFKYPGPPFRAETPWKLRHPAPLLGQHNEEIYRRLGYTEEDLVKLRERGVI